MTADRMASRHDDRVGDACRYIEAALTEAAEPWSFGEEFDPDEWTKVMGEVKEHARDVAAEARDLAAATVHVAHWLCDPSARFAITKLREAETYIREREKELRKYDGDRPWHEVPTSWHFRECADHVDSIALGIQRGRSEVKHGD